MRCLTLAGIALIPVLTLGIATGSHADSLILHIPLDDGSGSATATDASGNGLTGTLVGMDPGTDWVAGMAGSALDFDGVDDYVVVADDPMLDFGTGNFTVSCWVNKGSNPGSWQGLMGVGKWSSGASPGNNEWQLFVGQGQWNDNRPIFLVETDESLAYAAWDDTFQLSLDTWHHLVGSREDSTLNLYVDGILLATDSSLPPGASIHDVGRDLRIATNQPPWTMFFTKAQFDDVQIYDWALADGDVAVGETAGGDIAFLFGNPGTPIGGTPIENTSWGRLKVLYAQ